LLVADLKETMEQIHLTFPEGSAVCAPGDYLICRRSGAGRQIYRVDDLLMVKRLVPSLNNHSALMLEEHLLDSMAPAYFNEVQLLLTAFDSNLTDESEVLQAIQLQTLNERAKGLLRAARDFTGPDCRVVRQQTLRTSGVGQ
jgi:hypothetical protein